MRPKPIAAHRGSHSRAHENTLEAFQLAIECGADMIEFDIRRTADRELIIHHDDSVGGATLAKMEYPEALERSGRLGYRIPLLSELLELTSGRIRLDVELKETGYEEEVIRAIFDGRFRVADFVVTSFERLAIDRVSDISPGIRRGLLISDVPGLSALQTLAESGAAFLAPDWTMLDRETLDEAERRGVAMFPWTVDNPEDVARLLAEPAVEGIITNRPEDALRLRAGGKWA